MCHERIGMVSDLSNKDLARLLLRLLWQRYDVGGISMGRSPQSRLLEAVMGILPLPDIAGIDSLLLGEMIEEGRTRLGVVTSGSQLFFSRDQLIYLPNLCIGYLLLKKLSELFHELESSRGYPVSSYEKEVIDVAGGLLSADMVESLIDINKLLTQFSRDDLFLEVGDRVYFARKNKPRLF